MNPDILRAHVEALATSSGREVGSSGHEEAKRYLLDRLRSIPGLEPADAAGFVQPYEGEHAEGMANIIARIPGSDPSLAPVLLGAHYDTAGPLPGADDNAAAVAILLELLPRLLALKLERPVLAAFFDAEEPPCFQQSSMGSTHWYKHQRRDPVHCAVIMDLVGHDVSMDGGEHLLFVTGMESQEELAGIVLEADRVEGLGVVPTLNSYIGDLSDHHAFREDQRPYLFFSCGHRPHYHAPSDTPEKLNYRKMAAIGTLLESLVPRLCSTDFRSTFEGYDSLPAELDRMQAHLGPMIAQLGISLESREDVSEFVMGLISHLDL